MAFVAKGPSPGGEGDPLELSSYGGVDSSVFSPPQPGPQVKSCDTAAKFDADIALALTASGWRATAALLIHAAQLIEAGDFQSAERNRRQAREQFNAATDAFRQFQEARGADAAWISAEVFLRAPP